MKSFIAALILLVICFPGCKENPIQPSGPSVEIISPAGNLSNYDSVYVTLRAEDDKKVVRLELFIDHELARVFTEEPYTYTWYTAYFFDGSQHVLEARAYDEDGNDAISKPVIIYTYRFRPSNLTATFLSDSTVNLFWTDNSTVETGFEVEKRVNNGEFAFVQRVDSNVTHTIVQCNNAFTDTIYFRVRAVKGEEKSEYSNIATAYRILAAPSNVQFTFASDTTLHVTWKDNTAFESGYRIQVNYYLATIDVPANTTEAFIPLHLINGTIYSVAVTAIRGNIIGNNGLSFAQQFIAPSPFDIAVSSQGSNQLTISWKDTCAYEKGFIVERADASSNFSTIGRTGPNVLQFTDTNVDSSKQYLYRITTETKYSVSFPSRVVSVGYLPNLSLVKSISLPYGKRSLLFSKDLKKAVTAEFNSRTITVWNTESLTQEASIVYEDSTAQGPQCAALHPDGKTVAVGFYYKYVVIFDVASGNTVAVIDQAPRMGVEDLRYTSDGTKLVTCGSGLSVWEDKTYTKLGAMVNTRWIGRIDYSPTENVVIANSGDGGVKMYDVNSFALIRQLQNSSDAATYSFNADGSLIVGRTTSALVVWDSRTGSIVNQITNPGYVNSVGMNSNPDLVFTSTTDKNSISIWSLKLNKQIAYITENLAGTEQIQLSADDRYLYSAGWNAVQKWEIRNEWKAVM